ncbi:uncharacterized protein LOC100389445 isoform X2 [Callithrix jacchus]|uniref:uncharacterized protein LOC100389445 isoform X2 n=1 Tax=Callithrix jacchus TaxID=9483 RepID=UPI00159D9AAD|nr:uncharacterized protein LOC100389445 isoform X2 [Callithrix jacchus]
MITFGLDKYPDPARRKGAPRLPSPPYLLSHFALRAPRSESQCLAPPVARQQHLPAPTLPQRPPRPGCFSRQPPPRRLAASPEAFRVIL